MLRGNETNQAGDGRRARDVEPEAGRLARGPRREGLRRPKLKGSIGEGPNHSNFSDRSSVTILSKFRNFR